MSLLSAEAERLQSVVSGLILLSSIDDRGLPIAQEDVDVDDIVLTETRRLSRLGAVEVRTKLQAARCSGDEQRLSQVVRNLLDNAARHARSTVLVDLSSDGHEVLLAVEDDGNGVAEADRERIFDRFVRLDESRTRDSGGSGLGLAIVAEIVRAHHGAIHVEQGQTLGGARFVVRLPAGQ